ncbi:CGNR zinc finger domain-containing protein [Fibrella sp. WM1]|uniref:CGNR zinc finger domain-containing protein n=1 Tax=Fibrella musci TaxID=3242485 RepID=UPI0035219C15
MAKTSTITEMDLTSGVACLDFVNTGLNFDLPVERLHTYADLVVLIERLSLLDTGALAELRRLAAANPGQAEHVLQQARKVRGAMTTVVAALVERHIGQVDAQTLAFFNSAIQEALAARGFMPIADQLVLSWLPPAVDLRLAIWVFSLSAYELLLNQDQTLIKPCGACAWFFLDQTKNHRRKWCDMQTCGTHQKARRYYQRKKQLPPEQGAAA